MSKLDDITFLIYQCGFNDCIEDETDYDDKDAHKFKESAEPSEGKQQIKDLMLELIGYGSNDIEYDMEKLSLAEKGELIGRNKLTSELRQKVEAL